MIFVAVCLLDRKKRSAERADCSQLTDSGMRFLAEELRR